jgi:tetratricopeptide repeat protein
LIKTQTKMEVVPMGFSRHRLLIVFVVAIGVQTGLALQKTGRTTAAPSRSSNNVVPPTVITGKVVMSGGGPLADRVAIERVCSGTVRREAYTDSKGHFEISLGETSSIHDASEVMGRPAEMTVAPTSSMAVADRDPSNAPNMQNCEIRASLPGFDSTSAPLKNASSMEWQIDVGTIYLKRRDNVLGATISVTTMNAPKDARQAYEKAEKALAQQKADEAEKELNKAVQTYPEFASAWSLLGDIHRVKGQLPAARAEYSKAIAADAQYVNPRYGLAMVAVLERNWPDSARLTQEVIQLNGSAYPSAYFFNAVANLNTDRLDAAEESARKYKELDAKNMHPDVRVVLGNVLALKGDFPGAIKEMQEYLTMFPTAPNVPAVKEDLHKYEQLNAAKKQ